MKDLFRKGRERGRRRKTVQKECGKVKENRVREITVPQRQDDLALLEQLDRPKEHANKKSGGDED